MISVKKQLSAIKYFPVAFGLNDSRFYPTLKRVYPLKQKYVQALLEYAPSNPAIEKIVLFGSSITMRCRIDSDMDVMVWLDAQCDEVVRGKLSGTICGLLGSNADVLFARSFPQEDAIWKDIAKGVTLYEQIV